MPGHFVPPLVHELLPAAKEVFLVRDFRDVACSVMAFSARTSARWSRPRGAKTDADYVRLALSHDARLLRADWRERAAGAHLVRYEDLITTPQETLAALFDYLGVESGSAAVEEAIRKAKLESPDAQAEHRTSPSLDASIGRWRTEMKPDVMAACEETLAEPLQAFGYGA